MQTLIYASLKTKTKYKPRPSVYEINKRFSGRSIVKKIYSYLFDIMVHNKFIENHMDAVEIKTFEYSRDKQKFISEHVVKLINNYEYDYGITVTPYTHVIVCGEEDFFDAVNERHRYEPPFFGKEATFNLDIKRNGSFQGFMIHVCPGISGFAILPKAVIAK
jgi:hypothetical protein